MILRQYEVKHYGGLASELPTELPYGDTYFAEDTGVLYKYNQQKQPIAINPINGEGIAFGQTVDTYSELINGSSQGELAYVFASQGTKWLPGTLGGTYYPSGAYFWDGVKWVSDKNSIAEFLEEIKNRTGWAAYADTQYTQASPFLLPANTPIKIPNNGGSTREMQKPPYISTYWDVPNQKILGREGDGLDIMTYWKAVPTALNAELKIWVDIGGRE